MLATRRLYIYLITFISLLVLLAGTSNLLRLLLGQWLDPSSSYAFGQDFYRREQFSLWGALMVVGGGVWVIHWLLAQHQLNLTRPGPPQERQAAQRKLLIYATLFVTAWQVFFAFVSLVQNLMSGLLDSHFQNSGSGGNSGPVSVLLVYSLAWYYYWRVRQADCAVVPEYKAGATLRRWYFYLVCYGALSVGMYALADLASYLWKQVLPQPSQNLYINSGNWPVVSDIGWVLAGFGTWLWHWNRSQRQMASSEEEQRATLPRFYLYALVLQTVCVTLTNLSSFMYSLLRFLIGTNPSPNSDSFLRAVGSALLTAGVYGLFWAYHKRVIHRKEKGVELTSRQITLRNIYHYLVAFISLWVMAVGVAWLARLLVDFWLGEATTRVLSLRGWGDQISFFVTLILAGGPFWYFNWRLVQRQALTGEKTTFRQSLVRRIYLYIILFCSVLTLLIGLAFLVYRIFLGIGTNFSASQIGELSWALGASLTAGIALVYHLRVMRDDQLSRFSPMPAFSDEVQIPGEMAVPGEAIISSSTKLDRQAYLVLLWAEGDNENNKNRISHATFKECLPEGSQVEFFTTNGLTTEEVKTWLASRKER